MINHRPHTRVAHLVAASALALTAMSAGVSASAQEAQAEPDSDVIVVTALRREQSLQEVPSAVTALTPELLEQRTITNVLDLQYQAPNISLATNTGTASGARIFLRGVGEDESRVSADPAVGVYVDGVYIGRQVGALFDLVDLERVEVLRGPQGTLYGRNTNGGAIKLVSRAPDGVNGGEGKITIGNEGRFDVRATGNLALTDDTAVRLTGLRRSRDGFHRVLPNGGFEDQARDVGEVDTYGFRGVVSHKFNADWSALIAVDYTDDNSDPVPDSVQPGLDADNDIFTIEPTPGSECTSAGGGTFTPIGCFTDYRSEVTNSGVSATITGKIGDFTLQSLTGYRQLEDELSSRIGFPYLQETDQDQLSQEFTLTSNLDGPFNFVSGVYYFTEDVQLDTVFVFPFTLGVETDAFAVFGQGTYDFSDQLRLTGGVRYTDETKEIDAANVAFETGDGSFARQEERDFSNATYSIGLDYDFTDDVMGYVSYSTGFKSGGWSPDCFSPTACFLAVDEEELGTVEFGVRSELFEDALRLNATYFFNRYDDLQIAATVPGLGFTRFNVAETEIQGFELESVFRPTDTLDIFFNLGLLDGEYTSLTCEQAAGLTNTQPDCTDPTQAADTIALGQGLELKNAPSYKGVLGFQQRVPVGYGEWSIGADVGFEDESFSLVANAPPNAVTDPGAIFNARVAFTPDKGRWTAALWGQNLSDEEYARAATAGSFSQYAAPPLTWGVDLSLRF